MAKNDKALVQVDPREGLGNPVDILISQAIDRSVDVTTMEKLLAMREKLMAEQARAAYFEALTAFQTECPIIAKRKQADIQSRTGASYKYKFAPLDEIVGVVAPLLGKHGLSYKFDARVTTEPKLSMAVICTVQHVAGHSAESEFQVPVDTGARMNEMQQSASAQTYAKRYAFCNALGILTGAEDDDAHGVTSIEKSGPRFKQPRRTDEKRAETDGAGWGEGPEPPIARDEAGTVSALEGDASIPFLPPEQAAGDMLILTEEDEALLPIDRQQVIELKKAQRESGKTDKRVKDYCRIKYGVTSAKDIQRKDYAPILAWLKAGA